MKKRFLSLLLAALMLCILLPMTVSAENGNVCGDKLTWKLDSAGTLTVSGTGNMSDFENVSDIPWYSQHDKVKSVVIEKGVTSIGQNAFNDCTKLASIEIADSVTSIGHHAFQACDSLTEIAIPDGLTTLGYGAFYACSSLVSVEIPNSVTLIGDTTFINCSKLVSVAIPKSVTKIGSAAFYNCNSFKEVLYSGTEAEWKAIEISEENDILNKAIVHYGVTDAKNHYAVTTVEPTCLKKGYSTYTCPCGYTYEDGYVEALGHDYKAVVTAPTCTANGYTTHTCSRCGDVYKDSEAFSLGHYYNDGVCTRCGEKDPNATPKKQFTDVSKDAVYYDAVVWASNKGITSGYGNNDFRPQNPCTRAQVVTFLWRDAGCPEPTGANPFADVENSGSCAPYYKAILWAAEKKITTGVDKTHFNPNGTVTRAQFVTFLWRYEGSPDTKGDLKCFSDAKDIATPYQTAVKWAVEKGITTGYEDGTFRPNATCTRWAVVLFMQRDLEK